MCWFGVSNNLMNGFFALFMASVKTRHALSLRRVVLQIEFEFEGIL